MILSTYNRKSQSYFDYSKLIRLDSHRGRPLLNFEEENRARITHVCRNGDIMTCSSLNKGFECARYHNNKWKTIKKFEGKKLKLASIQCQNIHTRKR